MNAITQDIGPVQLNRRDQIGVKRARPPGGTIREYYILDAQNGDKWAAEDQTIDQKLAEGECVFWQMMEQ